MKSLYVLASPESSKLALANGRSQRARIRGFLFVAATLMLSMARESDRSRVLMAVSLLILMFPAVTGARAFR